jgi:hypothetical protein
VPTATDHSESLLDAEGSAHEIIAALDTHPRIPAVPGQSGVRHQHPAQAYASPLTPHPSLRASPHPDR